VPSLERLRVIRGDITRLDVDAIVNAANTRLKGGGGVDGAIHRAAGPELLEACLQLGGCPTGQARITPGYRLPARWVIHAVGPFWSGGQRGEDALLASAYRSALLLASEHNLRSLAFPSISTGAYRFPVQRAAGIAVDTIQAFLAEHDLPQQVTLVTFSAADEQVYQAALAHPSA
jgi:O-acetyl-ADP-ribose deacetylase